MRLLCLRLGSAHSAMSSARVNKFYRELQTNRNCLKSIPVTCLQTSGVCHCMCFVLSFYLSHDILIYEPFTQYSGSIFFFTVCECFSRHSLASLSRVSRLKHQMPLFSQGSARGPTILPPSLAWANDPSSILSAWANDPSSIRP